MNAAFNQHPNTAGAAAASSSTASLHQGVASGSVGPSLSPEHDVAPRKRGGRGPGKKEKDKPAVSVRTISSVCTPFDSSLGNGSWEEADLTDRLLNSIAANPRWAAVFTQAAPDQSRASTGVPKRDLQREIARHLFKDNDKFDLDDSRVVEALAVSVKNKLFKIQTLYTECKAELGPLASLDSEADIPNDPNQAQIWARVKEKFPQFFLARDLMFRAPVPRAASKKEDHYAKRRESLASPTTSNLPGASHSAAGASGMRKTNGRALSSEQVHYHPSHPITLSIGGSHPTASAPPLTGRIPLGTTTAPSPSLIPSTSMNNTYHQQRISLPNTPAYTLNSALIPVANPPAPTQGTAPPQDDVHALHIQHSPTPSPLYYTNYQPPFNHPTGPTGEPTSEQLYSDSLRSTKNAAELDINRSSPHFPPLGIQQHHQPQGRIPLTAHSTPPRDPRTGEFVPPNPFPLHPERNTVGPHQHPQPFPTVPGPQVTMEGRDRRPPSRGISMSPPPPSPPLGQSLAGLIGMLDDRKRKREDEWIALKKRKYDEQRQQRVDRDRERQHEREMLRLRIRLARVERGDLSRSPRELASPEAEAERVAAEGDSGGYDFGPQGLGGERQDEPYGLREVQGGRFGPTGNGRTHGEGMGGEEDGEGEVDVDPHSGDGNHPGRTGNGVPNERSLGP